MIASSPGVRSPQELITERRSLVPSGGKSSDLNFHFAGILASLSANLAFWISCQGRDGGVVVMGIAFEYLCQLYCIE